MIGRGPERRQDERREPERRAHYLGEAVLSKALVWREYLDGDASAEDRIRTTRELRDAIDHYGDALDDCAKLDAERGATVTELIASAGVLLLVVLPTSVLGVGTWGRWAACMAGLAALAFLLWQGERGRS